MLLSFSFFHFTFPGKLAKQRKPYSTPSLDFHSIISSASLFQSFLQRGILSSPMNTAGFFSQSIQPSSFSRNSLSLTFNIVYFTLFADREGLLCHSLPSQQQEWQSILSGSWWNCGEQWHILRERREEDPTNFHGDFPESSCLNLQKLRTIALRFLESVLSHHHRKFLSLFLQDLSNHL